MARKTINPDMDLTETSVPSGSLSANKNKAEKTGRSDINPKMDLKEEGPSKEANTGGKVDTGNRVAVNPNMELSQSGASGEATAKEEKPAVMPGVGNMPTGEKAAKKSTQPE